MRAADGVLALSSARNALFLLNPGRFADRRALVAAIGATYYDVIVLDAWFDVGQPLSRFDVESLQSKPGGGKRIVLAHLSIGEAEDDRDDWDPSWDEHRPAWLGDENPDCPETTSYYPGIPSGKPSSPHASAGSRT
jgi:cysteinyl-tRNA synthetase